MQTHPIGGSLRGIGVISMVTIDALSCMMYAQLTLTILLFFFVQLLVLFARKRIEKFGDWAIYRGSWWGIGLQFITMALIAAVVFSPSALYSEETLAWSLILTFVNTVWFITLRGAFLVADYLESCRTKI
jgi:hypothetical protein